MEVYHETLYWQIRKLVLVHEDADDVLQNTYIKIFKGLPNFKQKSSVKTWTYRIAYNESMRHLEKKETRFGSFGRGDSTLLEQIIFGPLF